MVIKTKKIQTTHFPVEVSKSDIVNGIEGCRDVAKCMERVSITRSLFDRFGVLPHDSKVRIDAGKIRWCMDGYRWSADTPKIPRKWLILFDKLIHALRRKKTPLPEIERQVLAAVPPHNYTVEGVRGTKIIPFSRERKDQINKARRKREAERRDRGDRSVTRYTLRQRVVGFR